MATESKGAALRSLDDDELTTKLTEAREELFNLKFQAATGQLENSSRLKVVRKEIARIHTIRHERTLGISVVDNGEAG